MLHLRVFVSVLQGEEYDDEREEEESNRCFRPFCSDKSPIPLFSI